MNSRRAQARAVIAVVVLCAAAASGREPPTAGEPKDPSKSTHGLIASDKAALAPWQSYIGGWKGVGQPKRGSNQGAWTETADWAWQFDKSRAAIAVHSPRGKLYTAARIVPADEAGRFELFATRASDKRADRFTGAANAQNEFVFQLEPPKSQAAQPQEPPERPSDAKPVTGGDAQQPARITLRQVADGKRLLILYERRVAGTDQFVRLAEVGYTRQGSGFAKAGGSGPECVVTGGLGTIAVQHQGQTYYVCCTGCRDLFNDDPAGVLADYRARKEKQRKEKEKEQ